MSFSYKLKSHPDKLLRDHLKNVAELSRNTIYSKFIENRDLLSTVAYIMGASHDLGKSTTFFQKWLEHNEGTICANHGFLSALFGYYLTKAHLEKIGKLEEFWHLPVIAWVAINRHHGDLKNVGDADGEISRLNDDGELDVCLQQIRDIQKNNLDEINAICSELVGDLKPKESVIYINNMEELRKCTKEVRCNLFRISRENNIKYYFESLFFYSVLLDSDKLDASETSIPERMDIPIDIVERYKEEKFGDHKNPIDEYRENAYTEAKASLRNIDIKNNRILSMNLPTGLGKTLAGLSVAFNLRERVKETFGFRPRVIYSLPFLSIIDQNSKVIEEIFQFAGYGDLPSNLFLKHHHLADVEYKEERDNELRALEDVNKALLLTEGWYSEIVITTFVQLFHSLITNKNRSARKFHNIMNSILVLDEIQSIPVKYWLLMNKTLRYISEKFNCWILLMTATEPLIFERKKEIIDIIPNKDRYFDLFDRYDLYFDVIEKRMSDFSDVVFNDITNKENKDVLVVLNTIDSCKKIYDTIKDKLSKHFNAIPIIDDDGVCVFPSLELIHLSTHVLPLYRLKRIDRIKDRRQNKRKVIITTQLVEAGVDIDVDIVYRDMAPLDSIIQCAGRCNRNGMKEEKGAVKIVSLVEDDTSKKLSRIYDSTLISATLATIESFKITHEKEFVLNAVREYYNKVGQRMSNDESRKILKYIEELSFSSIREFRLIEEKYESLSVFVEIDENAEHLREKLEETLKEKNRFERRKKILEIKRYITPYVLSIRCYKGKDVILSLPSIGKVNDFVYIPHRMVECWYKADTGFQLPKSDIEMRMW